MTFSWPRSLRARLLWLLCAAIAVTTAVQASIAYLTAMSETDAIFDYLMQQTAMSLRSGLPVDGREHPGRLPVGDDDDDFIVQVWTSNGLLVFRSIDLPALPQRAVLGFSETTYHGTLYRVFGMASPTHVIEVAQDLSVRRELAGRLALRTMAPTAVMTPLLLLVVWWVVRASLAPVARVRRQVAERQADDLSEVDERGLPDEIRPLMHELNLLFQRLRQAFDVQKTFVADAAHELRSPLAALKLQMQGLRRANDDAARELMSNRLDQGIDRATHLVEQLLVLARQQAGVAEGARPEPLVLADLARLEIADAAPAAMARGVDIGLERTTEARVLGHREALRILMRNLLDNAVKYTPKGGTVDVGIERAGDAVTLRVEDSGPGVSEADRQRVLDRFYRVHGAEGAGSGLGLAIVKAIAELHGARLSLQRSQRLGGLRVDLSFPAPA
jgi:two-component system OmpR family sensor kinase